MNIMIMKYMHLLKEFFETLDPFEGKNKNDFSDYLYDKSKEIEPKNQPPTKYVSKILHKTL